MSTSRLVVSFLLAGLGGAAIAHPGHESASFAIGFGHPLGGIDHLLAMLAVGLYASRQRGNARWALPAAFVAAMLAGAGLGAAGWTLPGVETGVALSVLVLGLAIAFAARLQNVVALPVVAGFAVFHGYAHQIEIGDAGMLAYAGGFVIATALLHVCGFALGRWLPESRIAGGARRLVGALVALAGAVLLAG